MTLDDAPDVLTVPEAAALARVGRNAMYQAVARGDIQSVRIGRSVRIPTIALRRFLGMLSSAQLKQVIDESDLVLVGHAGQGATDGADPPSQPVATDGQAHQLGRQLSLVRPRHGTSVAQATTRREGSVADRTPDVPVAGPTGLVDRCRATSARRRSTGIGST